MSFPLRSILLALLSSTLSAPMLVAQYFRPRFSDSRSIATSRPSSFVPVPPAIVRARLRRFRYSITPM